MPGNASMTMPAMPMGMIAMLFIVLMVAVPMSMAESMPAIRIRVMLGRILFQGRYYFFQKRPQLLPFDSGKGSENSFRVFRIFFLVFLRQGATLFRDGNNEIALILVGARSGDEAVSFQLLQNLAQGGGTDIERLHQFPLAHGFFFPEDGKYMRLRILGASLAVMGAGHGLQGAPEKFCQGFAGGGGFRRVDIFVCHFISFCGSLLQGKRSAFAATGVIQGAMIIAKGASGSVIRKRQRVAPDCFLSMMVVRVLMRFNGCEHGIFLWLN
jgi:hypothetical protein